jgi:RHS repeat-associated protein
VTGGVMKNTSDASVRELYLTETDADHDLSFDYVRYSSTGRADVVLRTIGGNDQLYLEINPTNLRLRQVDGGTLTTLVTYNTTVAEDAWYKLRAILDGTSVKIYWGAEGADFNEVISATTTETTTGRAAYFKAQANSEHGFDNIQLIAGTRSTTETFTYNNANEQITHAKNGVTTTMTYDDWGRLATRDDGTHDATYAYRYGSMLYSLTSDFPGEGNVTHETGGDGKRRSRVSGTEETWYNYAIGFDVLSTENDADGSTGALTMTNVNLSPYAAISITLADISGADPTVGVARHYAFDHLGSTRSVWNSSKASVGGYDYDPYGGMLSHMGEEVGSLAGAYTGKPWEKDFQMYYFPYRWYSPTTTKWISRDPLGMADGPNIYLYVHGNPVNNFDPMGDITDSVTASCRKYPKKCAEMFIDELKCAPSQAAKDAALDKLKKSVNSLMKRIEEHYAKIASDPGNISVNHWEKEIRTFTKSVKALNGLIAALDALPLCDKSCPTNLPGRF